MTTHVFDKPFAMYRVTSDTPNYTCKTSPMFKTVVFWFGDLWRAESHARSRVPLSDGDINIYKMMFESAGDVAAVINAEVINTISRSIGDDVPGSELLKTLVGDRKDPNRE